MGIINYMMFAMMNENYIESYYNIYLMKKMIMIMKQKSNNNCIYLI